MVDVAKGLLDGVLKFMQGSSLDLGKAKRGLKMVCYGGKFIRTTSEDHPSL